MRVLHAGRAAATVAVIGLVLAGCAGGASNESSTDDQTLRLAVATAPASFEIGNWTSGGDAVLATAVYDTMVTRGNDGETLPGVAESWEYSPDRTVLTFDLREGMTFTDGTPVDADAVVASFEAHRQRPASLQAWSNVVAVAATDDLTVDVTFSTPDAALLPWLAGTMGVIGAPDSLEDDSSQLEPVGSGPYTLNMDSTVTGSTYTLDRNPDHWNVDSYPYEHVVVSVMPDTTAQQNALRGGQIDVIPAAGSADIVAQFPEDQFKSGKNLPSSVASLWFVDQAGSIVPALADSRVREAINLAFDRETIATNLIGGDSNPTNQLFNPGSDAFSDELLDETPLDLERARALMAEAGYADGFEVTMPSTVITTTFESVISQSLSDIGITVTWESVAFNDFFARITGGSYGMYLMYNGFSGSDAVDLRASLSGIFNPFGTTTPELETLLATANSSSEEEQGAAFRAVNAYLVDEAWAAPLNADGGFWVASTKVDFTPPVAYGMNLLPFSPAETN